jgi:hypothetical protein
LGSVRNLSEFNSPDFHFNHPCEAAMNEVGKLSADLNHAELSTREVVYGQRLTTNHQQLNVQLAE